VRPGRPTPRELATLVAVLGLAAAASPAAAGGAAEEAVAASRVSGVAHRAPASVSCGSVNRGALAWGVELPVAGEAHVVPGPWRARGYRFGTAALVGLVERASRRVAAEHPGSVLGVADLSPPGGGRAPGHRSHQSGRDVDLLYYAVDPDGRPFPPDGHMPVYNRRGRATYARAPEWARAIPVRHFDLPRNWALVRALLTDPEAEVERIFVSPDIKVRLIRHAEATGEDRAVVARARAVIARPPAGSSHDDHMHVRIRCDAVDVALGRCTDGPPRRRPRWARRIACPAPLLPPFGVALSP
jgi:penicillin-insensitive murein DD-endopeptidase